MEVFLLWLLLGVWASVVASNRGIVPEAKTERKGEACFSLGVQSAPHRRRFGLRVAGRQQQLRLMRAQRARRFGAGGPPLEAALG